MIKDSGFSGAGNLFTPRFGANESIYASQLNGLTQGIQTSLVMPYLGEGPQIAYTASGTIITNGPGAAPVRTKLAPWQTVVVSEKVEGVTKYYVKVVRGVCNYTQSKFPFSPKTTGTASIDPTEEGCPVYQNECLVTDYAVYPSGSYKTGTDSTSDFMGGDAAIEIKNAADGGSDQWFVTVSKMDWWNKLNWNDADKIQNSERPWVSVFAKDSDAWTKTLTTTQNSLSQRYLVLPFPPSDPSTPYDGDLSWGFCIAKTIGYNVKKVAALDWNATDGKWDVTQYILHQVELPINYQELTRWWNFIYQSPTYNEYDYAVSTYFASAIDNLSLRSGFASISGYTINTDDWWIDLAGVQIPR
jgi:hypothetical protein